jgi:hypothetical protein
MHFSFAQLYASRAVCLVPICAQYAGKDAIGEQCEVGIPGRASPVNTAKPAFCFSPDSDETILAGLGGSKTLCKLCGYVQQLFDDYEDELLSEARCLVDCRCSFHQSSNLAQVC